MAVSRRKGFFSMTDRLVMFDMDDKKALVDVASVVATIPQEPDPYVYG